MRAPVPAIELRPTRPEDVPRLFEIQFEPEGNALAGTKPRDRAAFNARWNDILRDPIAAGVAAPRVILADAVLVGSINIFKQEETDSIGYWLAREHWGRGIATRAIALILAEVPIRPLFARVATTNTPSRRALERHGFVVTSQTHSPETDRNIAREMLTLRLQ